jgi:hypothetical protein
VIPILKQALRGIWFVNRGLTTAVRHEVAQISALRDTFPIKFVWVVRAACYSDSLCTWQWNSDTKDTWALACNQYYHLVEASAGMCYVLSTVYTPISHVATFVAKKIVVMILSGPCIYVSTHNYLVYGNLSNTYLYMCKIHCNMRTAAF